ncbi:putative lipid II flippase FtsW [Pasteurellaceae bacterium HPA106]|uniref:putative lipid II flippase FtsW n=1 Tax=Spirabiliibacterium pneumoniae TaxID=221400 RepID=UPI001AACD940|nr:putative lipid II flippase FtsW [Spirabiliibacterium pneumoniae]MBE2896705.1 putative lipid II flippase FtsW [Spirabiliibacterium pneumoniae]
MSLSARLRTGVGKWFNLTPDYLLYDRTLLWQFISLMAIGFVIITSASISEGSRLYDDPFYFAVREMLYIALACFVAFAFVFIRVEQWEKWSPLILGITFLLLIIVLIPGIGKSVNGARRWIGLGFLNFQPAEFAKFAMICYLSNYFVRRYEQVREKQLSAVKPAIVLVVLGFFLLLQPDFGSFIVLAIIVFIMLFLVGAKLMQFLALAAVGMVGVYFLILNSAYRLKRLTSFASPFDDPFGAGFQLTNSLIAYGRGEFFGTGLGNSIQKLEYLPEAHTDFIMAILGEEFGLLGIIAVLVLFALMLMRVLKIGKESLLLGQRFGGYFAFGAVAWFFFQGCYNLGMTMAVLPVKGFTFPFISYGGSSLMISALVIAVILRIDHENRLARAHAHLRED